MTSVSPPPQLAAVQGQARALRDRGDDPGARRLLTQALEAAKPTYGKDHPEVLATTHLLARWHREADDPAAARRVLEEALLDGHHRWGDADPLMLTLTFELGTVAEELGNRHEARRNFGRVATLGPGVLGDDSWQVRAARDYLGEAPSNGGGPAAEAPAQVTPAPTPAPQFSAPPAPSAPAPQFSAPPASPAPVSAPRFSAPPAQVSAYPSIPMESTSPYAPNSAEHVGSTHPPYSAQSAGRPEPYPVISTTPPSVPAPAPEPARGRGATVAAAIAAGAAVIAAIVVVVAVLGDSGEPNDPADQTGGRGEPVIAGEPPTDVRLVDEKTAITITWTDPSGGTVPFVVAGARAGQETKAMGTPGAGETSFKVNALNPRLDYCFTVLAVYSTNEYAPSDLVCTDRGGPGATPR